MRRALPLAAAGALAACTQQAPPPVLSSVSPSRASTVADTPLTVTGERFSAAVQADLDAPERSAVRAEFSFFLVLGGQRIQLEGVRLVSDRELDVLLPAGAAPS